MTLVKNKNGIWVHEEIKIACKWCGNLYKLRHASTECYKIGDDGIAVDVCDGGPPSLCHRCDEEALDMEMAYLDNILAKGLKRDSDYLDDIIARATNHNDQ